MLHFCLSAHVSRKLTKLFASLHETLKEVRDIEK